MQKLSTRSRITLTLIALFCLAFFVRVVGIGFPNKTVFDEGISATMASAIVQHQGIFDIHPPLAHLLDATLLRPTDLTHNSLLIFGTDYQNFPYITLRMIRVILGSLLVLVIFSIAYLIYKRVSLALIPAFLVAIDPALIIYSRLILPDMYLLFFGFTGVLLFLVAHQSVKPKKAWILYLLAALCFGLALSVKWTALGFHLLPAFYVLKRQQWKVLSVCAVVMAFTYVSIMFLFLHPIQSSKLTILVTGDTPIVNSMPLPVSRNFFSILTFIPTYTKNMSAANAQYQGNTAASNPAGWPLGYGTIVLLKTGEGKGIILSPNYLSWSFALLSLLFAAGYVIFSFKKKSQLLPTIVPIIIASFFLNYLPFFFLHRTFFLYHYFTALIFAFLLLPSAIILLKKYLPDPLNQKYARLTFYFLGAVFIFSVALVQRIYGV